jgi:hypothetical protein
MLIHEHLRIADALKIQRSFKEAYVFLGSSLVGDVYQMWEQ